MLIEQGFGLLQEIVGVAPFVRRKLKQILPVGPWHNHARTHQNLLRHLEKETGLIGKNDALLGDELKVAVGAVLDCRIICSTLEHLAHL